MFESWRSVQPTWRPPWAGCTPRGGKLKRRASRPPPWRLRTLCAPGRRRGAPLLEQAPQVGQWAAARNDVGDAVAEALIGDHALSAVAVGVEANGGILHTNRFVLLEHTDDVRHMVRPQWIEVHRRRIDDVLKRRGHVFGPPLIAEHRRIDGVPPCE